MCFVKSKISVALPMAVDNPDPASQVGFQKFRAI